MEPGCRAGRSPSSSSMPNTPRGRPGAGEVQDTSWALGTLRRSPGGRDGHRAVPGPFPGAYAACTEKSCHLPTQRGFRNKGSRKGHASGSCNGSAGHVGSTCTAISVPGFDSQFQLLPGRPRKAADDPCWPLGRPGLQPQPQPRDTAGSEPAGGSSFISHIRTNQEHLPARWAVSPRPVPHHPVRQHCTC